MTDERFLVCDENDWEGLNSEQREWMVFKTLRNIESRISTLEKQSVWHQAAAAAGGVIGGIVSFFTTKVFFK